MIIGGHIRAATMRQLFLRRALTDAVGEAFHAPPMQAAPPLSFVSGKQPMGDLTWSEARRLSGTLTRRARQISLTPPMLKNSSQVAMLVVVVVSDAVGAC